MVFSAPIKSAAPAERTDVRGLLADALDTLQDLVTPGVPDPDLDDLCARIRIALNEDRVPEVPPFQTAGAVLRQALLASVQLSACLPAALPGHWLTPEGQKMAARYAAMSRAEAGFDRLTDFDLANQLFMLSTREPGGIVIQTAAKQRMRWLSAHLAVSRAALVAAEQFMAGFEGDSLQDGINEKLALVRAAIAKAEAR